MSERYTLGAHGWLVVLRGAPAIGVVAGSWTGWLFAAGTCQVLCVWSDWAAARYAARRRWQKTSQIVSLEALVDFCAFVWAPVTLAFAVGVAPALVPFATLFVVAGIFRLARFQAQGLVSGRYVGLPVTYNGYIFPAAALIVTRTAPHVAPWILAAVFVGAAWLMATDRFSVPEL